MGGLFGGKTPEMPKPQVVRMPDLEDPNIVAARRRKVEERRRSGGRQGTILSDITRSVTGSVGSVGR